ncbi:MAG: RtcB family protein [bacterium]|nr:RtcB family protein [bacterium]
MKPYKIFGEGLEQIALDQFHSAMEQPFVVQGALMPDAHMGYSLPIGGVVATRDYVLPAWVGYDIGCGMLAVPTSFFKTAIQASAENIHRNILDAVPVGFKHNEKPKAPKWDSRPYLTPAAQEIFDQKGGYRQLGTLGGGNHFIEVGYAEDDRVWIIIHSGSRGIGYGIAQYYMQLASGDGKAREGHFGFDLESQAGRDYMLDQHFCLEFALENRRAIAGRVVRAIRQCCIGEASDGIINRNHNHAEFAHGMLIHRKGATQAEKDMMGVIPGNMRDGSYIVRGRGNPESLWSSSHGAGRVLGRKEAKRTLSIEEFEAEMTGIVAQVGAGTLDESPMAYKNIDLVMEHQRELVEVIHHVTPILNVKG